MSFKHLSSQIGAYILFVGSALVLLAGILYLGPDHSPILNASVTAGSWSQTIGQEFARNLSHPVAHLLLQLLLILGFSRVCARAAKFLKQPQVIGEMIAGILIGRSFLAYLWPEAFNFVFPEASMARLYILAQIGLILFMFVVGLELKLENLKNKARAAVLISHVSIVFPFVLGALLSIPLYDIYAPAEITFTSFALFMGIAMSITAFPVLAKILIERNLIHTRLGAIAITCAAVDDVTAWCVLAAVIGIVKVGGVANAVVVTLVASVYILAMLKVVRPLLAKALRPARLDGTFTRNQFGLVLFVLIGSAALAEIIGIHALFGAFLGGTVMPSAESLRANLINRIDDLSSVVFLPIFFAFTGMRMEVGALNHLNDWLICGGIISVAVIGKLVGSALAVRWSGMNWRDSFSIGALMNTRGLMELVVLNIGYDLGIFSQNLFTIMVIMALVTTAMTGPLLFLFMDRSSTETLAESSAAK